MQKPKFAGFAAVAAAVLAVVVIAVIAGVGPLEGSTQEALMLAVGLAWALAFVALIGLALARVVLRRRAR